MKKLNYIIILFCFCQFSYGQNSPNWTLTNTNGLVSHIYDILFVSDQQGYLIGDNKILETNDGGDNWNLKITSPIVNPYSPFTVFSGGILLKNDSIYTFLVDTNSNSFELTFSIHGTNNSYRIKPQVYGLGYNNCINFVCPKQIYSFNGGLWGLKNNKIVKTENGVETILKSNVENLTITNNGISAANTDWFYYSNDSAQTWDSISLIDTVWNFSILAGTQQMQTFYNGGDTMFAIGRTYPSYDYVSFDKGISWVDLLQSSSVRKPRVYHFYSSKKIIGSYYGVVLTSQDGGFNFTPDTVDYQMQFERMYILNDSVCFLFGNNGKVYKSSNSGGLTSVNKIQKKTEFEIYPNPATQLIKLNYSGSKTITNISLFDMQGKIIKTYIPTSRELSLINIPTGTYLLKINSRESSYNQKIVVQK